jgi:hypothetical protein
MGHLHGLIWLLRHGVAARWLAGCLERDRYGGKRLRSRLDNADDGRRSVSRSLQGREAGLRALRWHGRE